MGLPVAVTESAAAKRWGIRKQWYQQLKALTADLEQIPDRPVLDDNDQQRLGIKLSEFSAEPGDSATFEDGPKYFTPPLCEDLPISPCCQSLWGGDKYPSDHRSLWPREPPMNEAAAELVNDYYDGWELADVITRHWCELQRGYRTAWTMTPPGNPVRRHARYNEITYKDPHKFLVPHVFDMFSARKPHQILIMISDHPAEESSLLRSEVIAMTTFMKWKMRSMSREQSLVYPVMVISIMNLFKVRVLQGHFDGTLHLRRSKMYDFAVEDHEEVMKIMVCWLRSMPHGDTTLSTQMPIFRRDPRDNEDDVDENVDRLTDDKVSRVPAGS
ncbi:hypothetical protein FQN50_004272 [Emmonsiellopsis sp. PD_5]|nr:hypothetical protein FQN50_004272 [Emmonsiellopsis sp. PD_5]